MPFPLAPVAGLALRYGAVALAAYALARRMPRGRTDQRAEDALDELPEGVSAQRPTDSPGQVNIQARFRRILRLGDTGPGIDFEASAFGRLRMRKV